MIDHVRAFTVPAAYALLPARMQSDRATAMLLAIGLQESEFLERRQLPNGPARGFWQFERGGGVVAVLTHPATKELAHDICRALRYHRVADEKSIAVRSREIHYVLKDNDVLACVFARLLLWTVDGRLPAREQPDEGWRQYLEGWRPGRPHAATWDNNFREAWDRV